jgi:glutaminyl-peptide cyclotransferase
MNIPMVDIIQYEPNNPHQFADYWHTHQDNLDAVDPATLKAVGETLLALIYTDDVQFRQP